MQGMGAHQPPPSEFQKYHHDADRTQRELPLRDIHAPGSCRLKTLSCGILMLSGTGQRGELLLCHVTGAWHWDIPKGGAEPGESPRDTALRETLEECGVDLSDAPLTDLGRMSYLRTKDLHLFAVHTQRFNPAACKCRSQYLDALGRRRDEMDGFEWVPIERVPRRCARHMSALLGQRLPLGALLGQLESSASQPWAVEPTEDGAYAAAIARLSAKARRY